MHITEADRAAIVEWAAQRSEIAEVWLYGSRARGDHREDSDIDLAFVMKGWWPDYPDAWVATIQLSHPIDPQRYDPHDNLRIGPSVRRDGILLYRAGDDRGRPVDQEQ